MLLKSNFKQLVGIIILFFAVSACERSGVVLVMDEAGLLSEQQNLHVQKYHQLLLESHDIDYRVITTNTADNLSVYAAGLFKKLAIGGKSKTGRGLLLVINVFNDQIRLEVGRNLEWVYTDGFIAYIEKEQMVPFFRVKRIADGVLATTEMIVIRAQDAAAKKAFEPTGRAEVSTGAGATASANIGKGQEARKYHQDHAIMAEDSPSATLKAYIKAMKDRNSNPDLDIYTKSTRTMLKNWVVTNAQMRNVVAAFKKCKKTKIFEKGKLAVIRYGLKYRQCNPYFMEFETGKWKLDLTMMQEAIRFNQNNQWHFIKLDHKYSFAFNDCNFDKNGFPFSKK